MGNDSPGLSCTCGDDPCFATPDGLFDTNIERDDGFWSQLCALVVGRCSATPHIKASVSTVLLRTLPRNASSTDVNASTTELEIARRGAAALTTLGSRNGDWCAGVVATLSSRRRRRLPRFLHGQILRIFVDVELLHVA